MLKHRFSMSRVLPGLAALLTALLLAAGPAAAQTGGFEVRQITIAPQSTTSSWMLLLVNEANPLPADFAVETGQLANGLRFDARAIGDLQAMVDGAKADGVSIFVGSAYRPADYQSGLFQRKVNQYKAKGYSEADAYAIAKTIVAVPGTSEHSLGLAADIITPSYTTLDSGFARTEAYRWLTAHCAEYGFILRYPADKQDITGIIYEPWHYRYVGREAAAEIMAQGICLEEYHANRQAGDGQWLLTTTDAAGQKQETPVTVLRQGGRTLLPLRAIGQAAGAEVAYDSARGEITLRQADVTTTLTIGSQLMIAGGQGIVMDTAPVIAEGSAYVPVRYVGQALGFAVAYQAEGDQITLSR